MGTQSKIQNPQSKIIQPLADQRAFAKTGGCSNEDQFVRQTVVQAGEEAGARHPVRVRRWAVQFRCEQRRQWGKHCCISLACVFD